METRLLAASHEPNKKNTKMKVMVAMDQSECSSRALRWALENLCELLKLSQPIILFTVQPEAALSHVPAAVYGPARVFTAMSASYDFGKPSWVFLDLDTNRRDTVKIGFWLMAPELIRSLRDSQRRIAMRFLEKAREVCANYQLSTEMVVEMGEPKETICTAVDNLDVDLLIMGSHGKGAIRRAFLGSISNYCVQNARCAVLAVKKSM